MATHNAELHAALHELLTARWPNATLTIELLATALASEEALRRPFCKLLQDDADAAESTALSDDESEGTVTPSDQRARKRRKKTHDMDDVTLARVAAHAGVTKPVAYDHFGDRSGLLSEAYRAFEAHQRDALLEALDQAPRDLAAVSDLVAEAYIGCCIAGRDITDGEGQLLAAAAGLVVATKLSEAVDIMVIGDPDVTSPQIAEARSLGVDVTAERVFWPTIGVSID